MITIKDTIDVAYKISDKTDKYWNFFVVVHFVIVGWLITGRTDLIILHKTFVTTLYFSCILINYFALTKQYTLFYAIMTEIREQAKNNYFKTNEMNELLKSLNFPKRVHIVNVVHIIFVLFVIYVIWK